VFDGSVLARRLRFRRLRRSTVRFARNLDASVHSLDRDEMLGELCVGNEYAVGRRKSVWRSGQNEALYARLHSVVLP
jgi:hypothetical protein